MEQPPSFVGQGKSSALVYCVCKSLYDLKQFPKVWFGKLSNVIQQFGMTRSEVDHSFLYR